METTPKAGCCPTCGRPYAKAKRQPAPSDRLLTDAERAELSTADLYAYYKRIAPREDVRFYLQHSGLHAGLQLTRDGEALIAGESIPDKRDAWSWIDRVKSATHYTPEPDERAFWYYHGRRAMRERGQTFQIDRRELLRALRDPELPSEGHYTGGYYSPDRRYVTRTIAERIAIRVEETGTAAEQLAHQARRLCPWLREDDQPDSPGELGESSQADDSDSTEGSTEASARLHRTPTTRSASEA